MARKGGIGAGFIVFLFFLSLIGGGVYYVFTSKTFERNSPNIALKDEIYWNLTSPLKINIKDDSNIKAVKVFLSDGQKTISLVDDTLKEGKSDINLEINFPKTAILNTSSRYSIGIEAVDSSRWNFFLGNKRQKVSKIIVDTKKPEITVIDQSYKITKGGSALVVFKASDEAMKDVYILTSGGKKFIPTTFVKDGYYASLVAWSVNQDDFVAEVVAEDMAGNKSSSKIRYFLNQKKYKESKIALNDKFLDGKILDLTQKYSQNSQDLSPTQRFKFVNETLRDKDETIITNLTSQVPDRVINQFKIEPFYPLKNSAAVASFGDHRFYTYDNKDVSQSWHLGIDFASTAQASIVTNNPSTIVMSEENGIYGLNIILYHGFGLYTLYGHCSSSDVTVGKEISKDSVIGKTGTSGLAMGDHLHFGVIVQGVDVRPEEWMDKKWMQDNIYSVLEAARKIIQKS